MVGGRDLYSIHSGQTGPVILPACYPMGTGTFPGVKAARSSRQVILCCAKVKNGGAIPPLTDVLMVWCLIN
jgi:hypothetical protein